jgi:hypothetical protein
MLRRITFVLALSTCIVATAFAQQKPNFTGKWTVVSPADAVAGGPQTITHTDTTLRLAHGAEGGDHNLEFVLDGKEHRSVMPSHGSEIVTLYTTTWKGDQLTIASKSTYPNGNVLDQLQVWSLDPKGQVIVDLTETFTGRPAKTTQIVHKKQSSPEDP